MTPNRTAAALALSLILAAVAPGCGGASAESGAADAERARQVLRDTLDSWKKGEPLSATALRTPSVHVDDEDWLAGARLVGYRIEKGDELSGDHLRCPVVLTFRGNRGKARTMSVVYHVATDPTPVVTRKD